MLLRVMSGVAFPLLLVGVSSSWLAAAGPAADRGATASLHLVDGSFVAGELQPSPDPKVLRWRTPVFTQTLDVPLRAVNAVYYTNAGPLPKPPGEYCFELKGDDVLYGDLLGLTDDEVLVESAGIGRLHLRREQIRRLYRWKDAGSVYAGPNGLVGWKESAASPQWHDEGGQLMTDKPGASLFADLGIPEKAVIDVELSWKRRPDFVLALGVDERDLAAQRAFHLEVWDGDLVVVGETARDADVASVQRMRDGDGFVRIQAYMDQKAKRLIVLSPNGKPLATLSLNDKNPLVRPGVRLRNNKGDIRLENLRITRWNGLPPREARGDEARLHRQDGSIVYGQLAAFDPASKQFTMRDGATETVVPHNAVADVFLTPSAAAEKQRPDAADRTLRLVYRDGSRLSGTPTRIDDTHLTLSCPGVMEPMRLPLTELRCLIGLSHTGSPSAPPVAGRMGRLEMEGVSLKGRLVEGSEQPEASCLVWHPDFGLNASPLHPGPSGRIVYREPPPPPRPPPPAAVAHGQLVIINGKPVASPPPRVPAPPPPNTPRYLHLRSGDTIPCEVSRIDERGVTFTTPLSDATFVEHAKIKSVELIAARDAPQLDEAKRDRLLTLPRLQKASPPAHLICSKNGDFLRGRIVEMDATQLKLEVRLETRTILRDRVAQIIWLHADELTGEAGAPTAVDSSRATRVQTLRADGKRLTFLAQKSDGKTISGTSDVLGACRVELADADQLLFGSSIEQSAAKLAYHLWKLHHAVEPKFAQDAAGAAGENRVTGTESPLVGQSAFAFKLDLLDGSRFQLADHKGRFVVLEFWATWCGPCLQSMPLVDGVVREFADRKVELVAVNLEEQPEQIKATLERHKLKVPVALDRDGVVAAKYAVTAIPQTVLIDREGKIVRLFVGGGDKTTEALRKAIQELCEDRPSAPASPQPR
jgi:thiol-disulfide isomerase/thioredoxin